MGRSYLLIPGAPKVKSYTLVLSGGTLGPQWDLAALPLPFMKYPSHLQEAAMTILSLNIMTPPFETSFIGVTDSAESQT